MAAFDRTHFIVRALLLGIVCSWATVNVGAQTLSHQVVASAGSQGTAATVQLSWTVGEVAVASLAGGGERLTQGYQQPVRLTTGVADAAGTDVLVRAFPNPVRDALTVAWQYPSAGQWAVRIFDLQGRLVWAGPSQAVEASGETPLDLSDLAVGSYLLQTAWQGPGQQRTDHHRIQVVR
jgi:hypothetical protein